MRLVTRDNLSRGKALIDYAFSNGETPKTFETADLIGMCAAYIARGEPADEIHDIIEDRLSLGLANDMAMIMDTFSHSEGRGLWTQGPSGADVWFTHPKLRAYYPGAARRGHAASVFGRFHELDFDEPF